MWQNGLQSALGITKCGRVDYKVWQGGLQSVAGWITKCGGITKWVSTATLSNTFEISKNTPQTSKLWSKDLYVSCMIERSWLMQEQPPDVMILNCYQ